MGRPFCFRGVPLGFHLFLLLLLPWLGFRILPFSFFFSFQGQVLRASSIYISTFSPQHTRGIRVLQPPFLLHPFFPSSFPSRLRVSSFFFLFRILENKIFQVYDSLYNGFFGIAVEINSAAGCKREVVVARELLRIEATQPSEVVRLGAHQTHLRRFILAPLFYS